MTVYSECTNLYDIIYCSIGNGKAIVGNNSTNSNNGAFENKIFTNLVIPERVNGMRITEIGQCAFNGQKQLITVTINAKIKQINQQSFYFCIALTTINIPSTVEYIAQNGISCTNEAYGTSAGTLNILIEYPSALKAIGAYCIERKEIINLYYGGFTEPSVDINLFLGAKSATVYSPQQLKFGSTTSIAIGTAFFKRKTCVITKRKPHFGIGMQYISILIFIML